MFLRRLPFLFVLLMPVACGLADDPRDDDDKYTYIEDRIPDPAFRTFCLTSYDLNGDGHLSLYEARRILTMDCPRLGIRSLEGIAFFGRLQQLDCSGNELTLLELNVNRTLRELDCRANRLDLLGIDKLDALQRLDCSDNVLTNLVLPAGGLSYIVAARNDLRTLDISNCALIISRLDARENPRLAVVYKSAAQRIESLSIDGQTVLETR